MIKFENVSIGPDVEGLWGDGNDLCVSVSITAPRFWWHEFDNCNVGFSLAGRSMEEAIKDREFTTDDFSLEASHVFGADDAFSIILKTLNELRDYYVHYEQYAEAGALFPEATKERIGRCLTELLPQSYNRRIEKLFNYHDLYRLFHLYKGDNLDEWQEFCAWVKTLPDSELITVLRR